MSAPRALRALAAACVLSLAIAGCMEQVGVSNQTDNFSYGGQLSGKSGEQSYTWENTQGKAAVSWGGQVASGSFDLVVKDSTGKTVYSKSVEGASQSGANGETSTGVPGEWQVVFRFDDFTGQMGLHLAARFSGTQYCPPVTGC